MNKVQHEKIVTQRECNTNKVQHEKGATRGKSIETRKKCNTKIMQHEKSTETEQNLDKKHKRRVHYSAQRDNGPTVNRPLYTVASEYL